MNFMAWRRAVYVSLGTKMKLGFINGSISRPAFESTDFEQWRRVDLMFAIQTRYRCSNGPMIYQLQRGISVVSQDDLTLTAYLTKVTKLWTNLSYLAPTPKCTYKGCTCGVNKAITDLTVSTQLMQFLMGLHESYNSEPSQILMLDSLPDIEKAFSMVYVVEKQREVHSDLLHGELEWYKTLNDKKKKRKNFAANVEGKSEVIGTGHAQNVTDMVSELLKLLQNNTKPTDPISNFANYVHLDEEFAGATSNTHPLPVVPFHLDSHSILTDEHETIPIATDPPVESSTSHDHSAKNTIPNTFPLRRSSK
ncbi:UNVERIFIED_CONTAM: hypothetical protein Slati_3725900 [Sesamum latifolium]|uniref:Retrotransposon Copia-like N-terminal domain-containing protein n=1 Tax=Sesamum latifolium TaxID=2727402 RepID=A0AAW2U3Y1_9LAMI